MTIQLPALLEFLREEIDGVHDILDKTQVPKRDDGEPLSLAQRVQALADAYTSLVLAKETIKRCAG